MKINFDETYISISKNAGTEIGILLNVNREFEDLRNFLIPAIREGNLVKGTTQYHFLWTCPVKNKTTNRTIVLLCALSGGAPDPKTKYTLHVYDAISYGEASHLIDEKRNLFLFRKNEFRREDAEETERLFLSNLTSDNRIVYNGEEYFFDAIEREDVMRLLDSLSIDIKQIKARMSSLHVDGGKGKSKSLAYFSAEYNLKRNIVQVLQSWAAKKKPNNTDFYKIFRDVAREYLDDATFENLCQVATERKESICKIEEKI